MTLGALLKGKREAKGWKQSELATRAKINRQRLSKFETDSLRPSPKSMKTLSGLLDISEAEYIGFYEPSSMTELLQLLDQLMKLGVQASDIRVLTLMAKQILFHTKRAATLSDSNEKENR